jgi:ubiquinone/menaquinone biosynthesis C-methylase UbiE
MSDHAQAEQDMLKRFEKTYPLQQTDVMQSVIGSACGCDFAATSWTTRDEVDRFIGNLCLGKNKQLLDLGAGAGWPGLYIAAQTRCDLILADIPMSGLRIAKERAIADGLTDRCWVAAADGARLPFRANSFDAINHTDVLCCLFNKRGFLSSCRDVIRPNGRMMFVVIDIAPGLNTADHKRAVANSPEFVETDTPYPMLLDETGWSTIEQFDISKDHEETLRKFKEAETAAGGQMTQVRSASDAEARISGFQSRLKAVADGLVRRDLYVATPA